MPLVTSIDGIILSDGKIQIQKSGYYAIDLTLCIHTEQTISGNAYFDTGITINNAATTHEIHNHASPVSGLHDCFNISCIRYLSAGDKVGIGLFVLQSSVLPYADINICKI